MYDSLLRHGLQSTRLPRPRIFQARALEWVAISFSRGSSRSRDQTQVSRIVGSRVYHLSHQGSICLQCRRLGFNSWVRKISWRRDWQRTPVFLPPAPPKNGLKAQKVLANSVLNSSFFEQSTSARKHISVLISHIILSIKFLIC